LVFSFIFVELFSSFPNSSVCLNSLGCLTLLSEILELTGADESEDHILYNATVVIGRFLHYSSALNYSCCFLLSDSSLSQKNRLAEVFPAFAALFVFADFFKISRKHLEG
jgi:hypothetical protein